MRDTQEIWKDIPEVSGIYSVSDKGRIRNNRTRYILKPQNLKRGYRKVNLKVDGISRTYTVHRLVARAYIPNSENKPEVNHKNGNKGDNRVENLEWVTGDENRCHAYETGLQKHKDCRYSGYLYGVWKKNHRERWCDEWQNFLVFREWCFRNGYEDGLYIGRKDLNGIYSPENCYISLNKLKTPKRRDLYKLYRCFGADMTVNEISEVFGISEQLFIYRVKSGMSPEEAATMPLRKAGRPKGISA